MPPPEQATLRLAVLDCAYESWEQERTQQLFSRMIALKKRGYAKEHGSHTLPFDGSDFVSTHFLVCEETRDGLLPIMGLRAIPAERCRRYGIPLPLIPPLEAAGNCARHLDWLRKELVRCERASIPFHYISSWTIAPEIREQGGPRLQLLSSLFGSFLVGQYGMSRELRIVGGGVVKFRVPRLLALLGFERLSHEGEELGDFGAAVVHNEPIRLMALQRFSAYAFQQAERTRELWQGRLVIAGSAEARAA